ncbi:hypothetical protein PEBR_21909 [Penicillium brasilianum]|uniref:Zn(2)-C6 fungal-type domain-containing protein n=1 Tax=Penicillium brasilianum TaxID=104259 RepID=A0A1S9RMU0_PENBI|nr:hypothetical protein PEBR_21909 [Penicillium brasilianum]
MNGRAQVSQDNRSLSDGKARAAIACDECARTKIRCDDQFPCGQCQRKSLVCTLDRPHPVINRRKGWSSIKQTDSNNGTPTASQTILQLAPLRSCHKTAPREEAAPCLEISDVQESPVTNLPVNTIDEHDLFNLGVYDLSMQFPQDLYIPFSVPSPDINHRFPHIPWPMEDYSIEGIPDETSTTVTGTTELEIKQPQSRSVARAVSSTNPYANCPFEYRFKRGPTVHAGRLSQFLHDQTSWRLVNTACVPFKVPEAPVVLVFGSFRDAIAARIHGMVYKLLDQKSIPHLFPPLETIQSCFTAYRKSFLPLYPIVHPTTFSESSCHNNRDPYADIGLFLTTIMALGCLVVPIEEARAFSIELVYLIRFNITDNAFHDETCLADHYVLSAWVMVLVFSAWSGIKRHMEMAEAFKGIPSVYFLRRGYYNAQPPIIQPELPDSWSSWIDKERDLRLCQVLFLIDHEISLLHSVQPTLNFTQMHCPMPVSDELFFLSSEDQWRALVNEWAQAGHSNTKLYPPSLASFYRLFLRQDFLHLDLSVTPLHLRLLLCAIQSQVAQYAQCYRFIPIEERFASPTLVPETYELIQLRQQEEFENMLVKWNLLADRVFTRQPAPQFQTTSMLVSQLVWLELYICFDDIQLIAGKNGYKVGRTFLPHLRRWTQSSSARKAVSHAANVIWILQDGEDARPIWWPLAVTRVALVMWCYIVGLYVSTGSTAGVNPSMLSQVPLIALNDPTKDIIPHGRTFQPDEGIPCIQNSCGKLIPLYDVPKIFEFCIHMLNDSKGPDSPILESARQFLHDIKNCGMPYTGVETGV